MHPIAKTYLEDNELDQLGDYFADDPNPTIKAIYLLKKAFFDPSFGDQAIAACEKCYSYTEKDKVLALIFLDCWLRFSAKMHRLQECEAILNRIKLIDLSDEKIEFQIIAMACDASMKGVARNLVGFVDSYIQICEKLPSSSPKYGRMFFRLCLPEARRGRLDKYQKKINLIVENKLSAFFVKEYKILEFYNLIEQCEFVAAEEVFPKIQNDEYLRKGLQSSTSYSQLHLELLNVYYSEGIFQDDLVFKGKSPVFLAHIFLLNRQPEKAHKELQVLMKENNLQFSDASFFSYTQIRVELSNRNADAARWLLKEKYSLGSISDLDNFYFARAEIINRDLSKAKYYLKKLKSSVVKYGLQKRLDFEVDLACELVSNQFYKLYDESDQIESTLIEIPPPKIEEGKSYLVGRGKATQMIRDQIEKLSVIDLPILIVGETGTGKEVVAKSLHENSTRASEPFVAINCGAVSNSLLQSELFGYEKGAFTGATSYQKGIFEDAGIGTVFLDEIGEISQQLQVALLRLLESGEYRPVGGRRPKKTNCRIIAATNAPLEEMVEKGIFRKDLLYRLERLKITLPPLRERKEDIEDLTVHFIKQINKNQSVQIGADLIAALKWNKWPGNIRELRNVIERMVLLNSKQTLFTSKDLDTSYIPPSVALQVEDKSDLFLAISNNEEERAEKEQLIKEDISFEEPKKESDLFGLDNMPSHRRVEYLKQIFKKYRKLNRSETAKVLKVSPNTAAADLNVLIDEGLVEKVMPSKSPRSHYFKWIGAV